MRTASDRHPDGASLRGISGRNNVRAFCGAGFGLRTLRLAKACTTRGTTKPERVPVPRSLRAKLVRDDKLGRRAGTSALQAQVAATGLGRLATSRFDGRLFRLCSGRIGIVKHEVSRMKRLFAPSGAAL